MPRRTVAAACASIAVALGVWRPAAAQSGAATHKILSVRAVAHTNHVRIVWDLSSTTQARAFVLANPARIVVDVLESDLAIGKGLPQQVGVVKQVRLGKYKPTISRTVLDLAQPALIDNAFVLPAQGQLPARLVVDVRAVTAAQFTAFQKMGKQVTIAAGSKPASQTAYVEGLKPTQDVPAPPEKPKQRKYLITIDPGHGGRDPGAIGLSGVYEKNLVLALGRELAKNLEATQKYEVVMTRATDKSLRLRDRYQVARKHNADLFISLHADANPNRSVRGLSVYTLSENASDKEAGRLAKAENNVDVLIGVDLQDQDPEITGILIDLQQRETMNLSAQFAGFLVGELRKKVKLLRRTHRFAGFAVLKAPDVPSVLIESGYLSNAEEERLLRTPGYRRKLAAAIANSVDHFFQSKA
jgi:N-acetylmuramoyl-L-alanine amidase